MSRIEKVSEYPLLPSQAFRCFPEPNEIKIGKNRKLFNGGLQPDESEKKKLQELEKYLKQKGYTLDPYWNQMNRLKFFQSAGFNCERAYKDMTQHSQWRARALPPILNPKTLRYLKQGIFYLCGRDCRFRPILVYNLQKIVDNKIGASDFEDAITYFFDYIINNCLIDGQIETWVSIIDVNFLGLFSFASELKTCIGFLSKTFKCRMHSAYIIRTPSSIGFMWGIAKRFMEEDTIKKINLYDTTKRADKMFEHCNASQIQRKYGGDMDEITEFWPPKIYSSNYQLNSSNNLLVSVEQYRKMYELGELSDRKVDMSQLIKHPETALRSPDQPKDLSPRRIPARNSVSLNQSQNNKVLERVSSYRNEHRHVEHQQLLRYQHLNEIIVPTYEIPVPQKRLPLIKEEREEIVMRPPTEGLYIAKPSNQTMSSSAFSGMGSILSPKFHSYFPRGNVGEGTSVVMTGKLVKSQVNLGPVTEESEAIFNTQEDEPIKEQIKLFSVNTMSTQQRTKYFP